MSVTFDVYVPGRSLIHRLDARVKLVALLALAVSLLLADGPVFLATTTLIIQVLLLCSGVPPQHLGQVWRALLPLLILVLLLRPLFDRAGQPVLLDLGILRLTGPALLRGLAAALRLAALSFAVYGWLATTSERDLVRSLVRLGLPHGWGVAVAIGLRAIPTLADRFTAISDAQQARGLNLDGTSLQRLRTRIPILVATVVAAIRTVDQMGVAVAARAYSANRRPTVFRDLQMRPVDWLILALNLVGGTLLLAAAGTGRLDT